MCYEHMLTQDPERLIEDADLDEPRTRAGSAKTEMPGDRSDEDHHERETTPAPV